MNKKKYIGNRLAKIKNNEIFVLKLLEIAQYTIIYSILSILLALILNLVFPKFIKKNILIIIFEIILQLIFITYAFYFIKKIGKLCPLIFPIKSNYIPYNTITYLGAATISLNFFRLQPELTNKYNFLSDYILKLV
jgi:hypothetical protein